MDAPGHREVIEGLVSGEPAPELRDRLELFGRLAGDWEIEGRLIGESGEETRATGDVHFGLILEGTAVQDVWSFRMESPPAGCPAHYSGTTVRFPDPALGAWRCVWVSPRRSTMRLFVARGVDGGIVLEGTTAEGHPERWIYSEMARESFRWHAEESHDAGRTWRVTEIIHARRAAARRPGARWPAHRPAACRATRPSRT